MKTLIIICVMAPLLTVLTSTSPAEETNQPFVVVELFSSEGCSSCPGPEADMNKRIKEQTNANILYISELTSFFKGGKVLGQYAFNKRLEGYEKKIKAFFGTPTAVVNGEKTKVIDSIGDVESFINEGLKSPPPASVDLRIHDLRSDTNRFVVAYKVGGQCSTNLLNIYLLESGIVSDVKEGENKGQTLHHDNLARVWKQVQLNEGQDIGQVEIVYPESVKLENCKVAAFIEDIQTMKVLGGTKGCPVR